MSRHASQKRSAQPLHLRGRLWGYLLIALLAICIIFLSLLPTLISTERGNRYLLCYINERIPGHITFNKLKIGWLGPQIIEDFSLIDAEQTPILSFKSLHSTAPMLTLMLGSRDMHTTELIEPKVNLEQDESGVLLWKKALYCHPPTAPKKPVRRRSLSRSLARFSGNVRIERGEVQLKTPKIEKITLSGLEVEITERPKVIRIVSTVQQGASQGSLLASGHFEQGELQIIANVNHLPTALLDQLGGSQSIAAALGDRLDLSLAIEERGTGFALSADVQAANLRGTLTGMAHGSKFTFDPASELTFICTPAFFNHLFHSTHWQLANKVELMMNICELELELPSGKGWQLNYLCLPFSATIALKRAELIHTTLGNVAVKDIEISFLKKEKVTIDYKGELHTSDGLAKLKGEVSCDGATHWDFYGDYQEVPTALFELFVEEASLITDLLGPRFCLTTSGQWAKGGRLNSTYHFSTQTLSMKGSLTGQSDTLELEGEGQLFLPRTLIPLIGQSADFVLRSDISLVPEGGFSLPLVLLKIKNPLLEAQVRGIMGKRGKPLRYEEVDLIATGTLPWKGLRRPFDQGFFQAHLDGEKNELTAQIDFKNSEHPIREAHAQITVTELIHANSLQLKEALIEFGTHARALPISSIKEYFAPFPIETLFGKEIDVIACGTSKAQATQLDIEMSGSGFKARLPLQLHKDHSVSQRDKSTLEWELTPERFYDMGQFLFSKAGSEELFYRLMHKANFHMELDELILPAITPFDLKGLFIGMQASGSINTTTLFLEGRENTTHLTIDKGSLVFKSKKLQENVEGVLEASFFADSVPQGALSHLRCSAAATNLLTTEGKWDLPRLATSVRVQCDLLPVYELVRLFPLHNEVRYKIDALFGHLLNCAIVGEFVAEKGPVTCDIKASNLKAFLPLYFDHNHLMLTERVEAELTLTPQVNEVLLKDLNPFFPTEAFSNHPIRLFIEKEDFYVPLHPYRFEGITIGKGVLDLGKIEVRKGGPVQTLLEFLKMDQTSPDNLIEAWFTPIFFNLKGGTLSYKRFDILLAGSVHMALWGAIDLAHDRVQMVLGINPKNLRKRFNIAGLSKKEMFQVKMSGSTSKVELDWSAAYTRLGILLTRTAGGHIGYIVGGILEQLVEAFGEQPSPEPTTTPFPWEMNEPYPTDNSSMPVENSAPTAALTLTRGMRKIMEFLIP